MSGGAIYLHVIGFGKSFPGQRNKDIKIMRRDISISSLSAIAVVYFGLIAGYMAFGIEETSRLLIG